MIYQKNNYTKLALFANDTAIIAASTQKTQANKYLQNHIISLEKFYKKRKIKVNSEKTKLIYFSQKRDKPKNNITFHNEIIRTEHTSKYLGMTLDSKLKYTIHINKIKQACQATLHQLYPILNSKSPLNTETKLMLYKSYIRPKILYGCPIYSNASQTNIKKLQIIQNKNLRLILNKPRRTPSKELHKLADINTIDAEILKHTRSFFNNKCKKLDKTKHLGSQKQNTVPYRIKHKLIHHKLMEGTSTNK